MAANDDGVDVVVAEETTHDLQSLLSSSERDYLVRNNGDQVKIDTLKGKKVGIYFSASWCGPCRRFTPNLVEVYNELLPKGDFEIVFASADEDDDSFDKYFSKMPWLAVPFSDSDTRRLLDGTFSVMGIPHLVILDGNGKVLTDGGVEIIGEYGANAYPFTEERIKEIEVPYEEMAKGWPEKVKHALHEHELVLTRCKGYTCDRCDELGNVWAFNCEECDFDLHPKCALEEDKGTKEGAEEAAKKEQEPKERWICDGEVCHKD